MLGYVSSGSHPSPSHASQLRAVACAGPPEPSELRALACAGPHEPSELQALACAEPPEFDEACAGAPEFDVPCTGPSKLAGLVYVGERAGECRGMHRSGELPFEAIEGLHIR